MASGLLVECGDQDFEAVVHESSEPVLVDFWGPGCGPCKAMEPMLERLAQSHQGRLKIVKVNVNQSPQTALKFHVFSLPTLILVKGGKVLDQYSGAPSPQALEKFIQRAL
jgi:thioredoxin